MVSAARPNIVFIFSDDHAIRALGAYGSGLNKTPHVDRIAREGALFLNGVIAATQFAARHGRLF